MQRNGLDVAARIRGSAEITVRHLAAHVSEGTPGTEHVYATQRYAKHGPILTKE